MKRILSTLLIAAFLTTSTSFAAPLTSYSKIKWLGINPRINPRLLSDDEALDASNITLDESGAIRDRDVFGRYNSTAGTIGNNSITGLFKFYRTTAKYFVCTAGSKIFSGSGGTWTDITQAGLAVTSGSYWSFITFNNELYAFNATCSMQNWNGGGLTTTPASVPATNCAYSAVHKSRAWAACSDTNPYRLYYSSLSNAEDWTTTGGYINLPDLTQVIRGLVSWGGYLFIYTETEIYRLQGSTPNDFSLIKTNSQVGSIAPRSIRVTDIGVISLARSGVFSFNGNSSVKLSDKVEPLINDISRTNVQNACAIYDVQNKYWLSYTYKTSSFNDSILIYDVILKEWYPYDNLTISVFEKASGSTDKGEIYGGSSTNNGIVWLLQASIGTESISHNSANEFNNQISFNTTVSVAPSVVLQNGNDYFTKLLVHFNGTDGQTTYTTEDSGFRTVTFNGTAHLDATEKKLGSSSVVFDGTNSVTIPNSVDHNFGTGDYTVEMYAKLAVVADNKTFIEIGDSANNKGFVLVYSANNLYVQLNGGAIFSAFAWTPDTNWHHVAVARASGVVKAFIDGTQIGADWANTTNIDNSTYVTTIGSHTTPVFLYFNGNIDEVRITKGLARYTSDFFPPYPYEYGTTISSGNITSQPIQINAAGQSALDTISWIGYYPTNTKITFQTRTGVTGDTVYFNNWQAWTSDNTVTVNSVTDATVEWNTNDTTNFLPHNPYKKQSRNILYYEDEDNISPSCVTFNTAGAVSTGKFAWSSIALRDLSSYDWVGVWYKSPQTGNTIEFSLGESLATENTITFNTIQANTWEKAFWYIGGIPSTSRDAISKISIKYLGDTAGSIVLGETSAYNFYASGDLMTSTPDNWIQYRGILGSGVLNYTPELNSITIMYTSASSTSETSLETYYDTKWIDFGSPQVNKQFLDFYVDVYTDTASSLKAFSFNYNIDNGAKTGTITIPSANTVTTNTVKIHKYFPSNTFGKTMQLSYVNNDAKTSKHTIRGVEIRFRPEVLQ